jgi:hypothetical protein
MEEIAVEVAMEVPTPVEVVVLVLTGGVAKCISPWLNCHSVTSSSQPMEL